MIVKDHINMFGLAGESPLRGPNDLFFGPRFFSINNMYSPRLRQLAAEAASETGIEDTVKEGVITISGGPNYESVAELKMFASLGVDCVGMSSIPECIVAHHCGIEEVLDSAEAKKKDLEAFVTKLVEKMSALKDRK